MEHESSVTETRRPTPTLRSMAVPTIAVMAVAFVLYGGPVPRLSEELYLPLARHVGDPAYLAHDWTMRGPFSEHWVFNHLFGPVAAHVPLQWFAWTGRTVTSALMAGLLVRIGIRIGLRPWSAAAAVTMWLVANQSLIGSEWMFGTFEAKTVAYCFLLSAIVAALDDRVPWAMAGLGATATFHPAVGLWAGTAGVLALLANPNTRRRALAWSWLPIVIAAPGVIGALSTLADSSARLARFVVLDGLPHHADPFFGGAQLPVIQVALRTGTLLLMFAANVWWYRRSSRTDADRFVITFQTLTMIPVALAFVARGLHLWGFLMLFPLRVGPLVVPLFFFMQLVLAASRLRERDRRRALTQRRARKRRRAAVLLGAGAFVALTITSPLVAAPRMVARNVKAWTHANPEADAFDWIRTNTPTTTRCVVPVDRQDAFIRAQRPIVANWQAIRYDALPEWKRRIDRLVGGRTAFVGYDGDIGDLRTAYNRLSARQIADIAAEYDADCIVATTAYPFPIERRFGPVRIYRIGEPPPP